MLGTIATLLIVGAFVASRVVGSIFRQKLAAAVHQKLKAELVAGSVSYWPPYSFHASDLRILRPQADGQTVELFSARGLNLKLARFPHKGQPAAIDHLLLKNAVIDNRAGGQSIRLGDLRLSCQSGGNSNGYPWQLTIADEQGGHGQADGSLDMAQSLLDVKHVSLSSRLGKLLALLPLSQKQWEELVGTAPDGQFSVTGAGTLPLHDPGRANFKFILDLTDASAEVAKWKTRFSQGSGRIVLHDTAASRADLPGIEADIDHIYFAAGSGKLRLDGGNLVVMPDSGWNLAKVVGSVEMGSGLPFSPPRSGWFFNQGEFRGMVKFAVAASGPMHVPRDSSALELIHHEILAYPHDVSVKPRKFPLPIEHISGGPIAFRGGTIAFQNLTGDYGGDKLLLRNARLTLEDPVRQIKLDDLKSQVKFEEIAGTVIFKQQPNPPYPRVIGKTVAALRPSGPFVIGGGSWFAINRPPTDEPARKMKSDSFIRLVGDGGSFAVTNHKILLTDIQGEATLTPMSIDIKQFEARSLGGTAWASGQIGPAQMDQHRPFLYRGRAELRHLDLSELARILPMGNTGKARLSGFGSASLGISGVGGPTQREALDSFVADGEVEIVRGDFWSVPPVQGVARQVKHTEQLGTGDAAAVIHVARRVIELQNAAVNSPVLGLQGIGKIGFDKSLDLIVVAAPLGDWRDKMKQAGIPLVGDVLGPVQQMLNTAQGALLYQFKVTGTTTQPVETLVPAPIITQPIALLFGQMLRQDANGDLLADVKGPQTQPATREQPASAKQNKR